MNILVVQIAASVLLSATTNPTFAAPALNAAFHGTIVSTYPDGRTAKLWLAEDGGYTAQGRRGDRSSGRWTLKGDKLCLHQSGPLPSPFDYCTPVPAKGMTHAWDAKAVTGERIRVRLIRGRD